jgi:hypothetical protein
MRSACTAGTSKSLPANLISIGDCAFWGCNSLKKVSLPAKAKVGNYAFPEGVQICEVLKHFLVSCWFSFENGHTQCRDFSVEEWRRLFARGLRCFLVLLKLRNLRKSSILKVLVMDTS